MVMSRRETPFPMGHNIPTTAPTLPKEDDLDSAHQSHTPQAQPEMTDPLFDAALPGGLESNSSAEGSPTPLSAGPDSPNSPPAELEKYMMYHDGSWWVYRALHPLDKWALDHCKKKGLLPSSKKVRKPKTAELFKSRPRSKAFLLNLQEMVQEHLRDFGDRHTEISGAYTSWKEHETEDVMTGLKAGRTIEISIDFKFTSST